MNVTDPPVAAELAFWVFGVAAVVSGYRVFRTDSMVRATFLLLASFLNVGAILLLLTARYLGFALMFMMTVEMIVMAIFMVAFMMNPGGLNPMSMVHQPRVAAAAGWAAFVGGVAVALLADFPDNPVPAEADVIANFGRELLGGSSLVFQTVGVTLAASMIGAVVLSSRRSRYGEGLGDDGSLPPPLDPATGELPDGVLPEPGEAGHAHAHGDSGGHGHQGGHS